MTFLDKLRQAYMFAVLNTREVHSRKPKQKYDNVPNYKIGDLVMIKKYDRKLPEMQNMDLTSELCT